MNRYTNNIEFRLVLCIYIAINISTTIINIYEFHILVNIHNL